MSLPLAPAGADSSALDEETARAEVYGLLVYHHEQECDEASMPADAKAAFRQMDAMFSAGGKETADEIAKRVMTLDAVADPEEETEVEE